MDFARNVSSDPIHGECHVKTRRDAHGGIGTFATRNIDLKKVIFQVDRDFKVKALSDVRLKDTCYYCLVGRNDIESHHAVSSNSSTLKICTGCKTVRYCSPTCQKSSWIDEHKDECRIFRKLYPRVLPSSVRATMRLLLGEDVGGGHMKQVLLMQDHLKELREAGGQRWQDLCLGAKATKAYSGTNRDEASVLRLFGILMTNSVTVVSPTYDPIGIALHAKLSYLNHSCEYNAVIRFNKFGYAEVVPIRPIQADEEILISYIDELLPYEQRQAELKERYFFTCHCPRCKRESSISTLSRSPTVQSTYDNALKLLSAPSNEPESINAALSALHKESWDVTSYPVPSLRQALITAYISQNHNELAFVHAMMQSFQLDPILFPATHHPIRMVHAWLCVRLIDQLLDPPLHTPETQSPQHRRAETFSLAPFDIDLDFWCRAIVVSLHRSAASVPLGDFSRIVHARYEEDRALCVVRNGDDRAYQQRYMEQRTLEGKWRGVQRAVDFVLREERGKEEQSGD